MNIKNIKIMATEYEVEEVEQIDKFNMSLGEIVYTELKIKIDKTIPEELKKETLFHEMLHGVLDKLGYTDINEDEQKVQSIASTLYLVLKENKLISFDKEIKETDDTIKIDGVKVGKSITPTVKKTLKAMSML